MVVKHLHFKLGASVFWYSQQKRGAFDKMKTCQDYAPPITIQITEVICPVIGRAQPERTMNKRQRTGPDLKSWEHELITEWLPHETIRNPNL